MNIKKIWNNRKFRTFIQTFLATISTSLGAIAFTDMTINVWICLAITAISTALSAIMPVIEEGD